MSAGLTLGAVDTPLTNRAADFLAAGPADAQALISHVCQLPGAPLNIAEHMAAALFAGHKRFARDLDGRWRLRESSSPVYSAIATNELSRQSFAVVDVETTGSLAYGGDRVTEVAVVIVRDGVATTVFDTLINPDRAIPPAITSITNITSEMVRNAPRFTEVCDQLLGALEGHVFVAHNVRFDWRFLSMEIERATRKALVGRMLCTVKMAKKLLPRLRRRNLDAVSSYYGIENRARHRAGGDAEATAQAFIRMLDAARDRGCSTLSDVEDLLARGTGARKRRRRASALPHSVSDDSTA
ncbi:MAG TPA: 3'-5' exonuclease [Gemmatimonadaceae bacterium]